MIKNVVIFCGANAPDKYQKLAHSIGKALAKNGFVTITGGGPGMMQQVNKGAFESKGESIGIRINHKEEHEPKFFTKHETHEKFDLRHQALLKLGDAFVVLPGGLGTILEAIEITQKKKFREIPMETSLIFVGEYFKPLLNVFRDNAKEGFVKEDLDKMYQYAKDPDEMIKILQIASKKS